MGLADEDAKTTCDEPRGQLDACVRGWRRGLMRCGRREGELVTNCDQF